MDGIIVVNKPKGITSRDVVNKACKLLNTKKIGHTGTLDPIATGVLVLCVGKATKLVEVLTKNDKEYVISKKIESNMTYTLGLTNNLVTGTYKIVIKLYDNDEYIGEGYEYLIIK